MAAWHSNGVGRVISHHQLIHRCFSQIQDCLATIANHWFKVAHFDPFWQCQNRQIGDFVI